MANTSVNIDVNLNVSDAEKKLNQFKNKVMELYKNRDLLQFRESGLTESLQKAQERLQSLKEELAEVGEAQMPLGGLERIAELETDRTACTCGDICV